VTATIAGIETGLNPVNIWMATLLFGAAIVLFNDWLLEVRDG
jgi:hypothetical protein